MFPVCSLYQLKLQCVNNARFLMGTNVDTPFFQEPTPEFRHGARARVQGLDLDSGTELGTDSLGTQCLNTAPFCAGAWAPSVNTA